VIVTAAAAEGTGWPDALPLLPHPGEIIVGVIAFAVLYWLYAKFVVPNMERMYAERTAAIEGGLEKAEAAQAEAAAALQAYRAQLADAQGEAGRIREQARADGAAIVAEMREQAQTEAARILAAAQQQIQAERQQAVVQLRTEVGTMATTLASRIVGESVEDHVRASRVIDRFLDELESGADGLARSVES
jgi:F-type H+-transporting ATPase subunit b